MIGIVLVLAGVGLGVGLYELGKYSGKNSVLLSLQAEVVKLEASLKAEEVKLAADVKALLAKIGL